MRLMYLWAREKQKKYGQFKSTGIEHRIMSGEGFGVSHDTELEPLDAAFYGLAKQGETCDMLKAYYLCGCALRETARTMNTSTYSVKKAVTEQNLMLLGALAVVMNPLPYKS